MRGRLSLWSDPAVKALAKQFICVADAVWRLHNLKQEPDSRFFQSFCDEGHYPSGSTRQGIYMFTASGKLLASLNTTRPQPLVAKLKEALRAWDATPPAERTGPPLSEREAQVNRAERRYPKDGLVLSILVADVARLRVPKKRPDGRRVKLVRGQPAPRHWQGLGGNRDHAWFTKAEVAQLIPRGRSPLPWPRHLAARFAAAHLLDTVRGQTTAFPPRQVKTADLVSVVEKRDSKTGEVTLRITGETHCASDKHGVKLEVFGRARLARSRDRFVAFDLLCLGTRWGATTYNFRHGRGVDDRDPSSIAFFASLCPKDEPGGTVAPSHLGSYDRFKR